jgi:hypothetical protein
MGRLFGCIAIIGTIAAFPAISGAQAAASICKDGTSSAATGRGACAQHGGVDAAATKSAKAAARTARRSEKAAARNAGSSSPSTRASARAAATVNCTDGTTGQAGRGACSHHGGVAGASANNSVNQSGNDDSQNGAAARARASRAQSGSVARSSAGASRANAASGGREDNDPAGALAQCNDGLYSHASSRRGACSRHGGVKQWLHA